jgi:hypothetical protein
MLNKCMDVSPQLRPLVLIFDEWHDKFEGASTKCNRKSVRANTITFLGPKGTETNPRFIYMVYIGNGSDDSHAAEVRLFQELDHLCYRVNLFERLASTNSTCCVGTVVNNPGPT